MTKHKRQHFNPVFYLKAWCEPNCPPSQTPYVWRFDRDGNNAVRKSPKNLFWETEFYTFTKPNGEKDLILEEVLQDIESSFASVMKTNILRYKALIEGEKHLICLFTAAMQNRTKRYKNFQAKQWGQVLWFMNGMKKSFESATPQERRAMLSVERPSGNTRFSMDEVKMMAEQPMQSLLPVGIEVVADFLLKMDLAILCTDEIPGYITSDSPCARYDPNLSRRRPLLRRPILGSPTIEVTLPISPSMALWFNKRGFNGYWKADEKICNEINRRTLSYTDEYFVVNRKQIKPEWFST